MGVAFKVKDHEVAFNQSDSVKRECLTGLCRGITQNNASSPCLSIPPSYGLFTIPLQNTLSPTGTHDYRLLQHSSILLHGSTWHESGSTMTCDSSWGETHNVQVLKASPALLLHHVLVHWEKKSWPRAVHSRRQIQKRKAYKTAPSNLKQGIWPRILKRMWPSAFRNPPILSRAVGGSKSEQKHSPVSFLPLYWYPLLRVERWWWDRGSRDLQRFPCALDLKVPVSVNFTSNDYGLLLALWSGEGRGISGLNTGLCLDMFRFKKSQAQCKNSSEKGLLEMAQDQG